MPSWYPVFAVAKYCGARPWELMEQPFEWFLWAQTAMVAEARAQESKSKNAEWSAGTGSRLKTSGWG